MIFKGKIVNSAKMEINVPENRKVRERKVLQLSEVQANKRGIDFAEDLTIEFLDELLNNKSSNVFIVVCQ